jgi:hypothetical protein
MLSVLFVVALGLKPAAQPGAPSMTQQTDQPQQVTIFAEANTYASFPDIIRTEEGLVVNFHVQDLAAMKATGKHPHYGPVVQDRFAFQRFGQEGWTVTDELPELGKLLDVTRAGAGLDGGGMFQLRRGWVPNADPPTPKPLRVCLYPQGAASEEIIIASRGPAPRPPTPFGMVRLADGSFLAAVYGGLSEDQAKPTGTVEGPEFERDWPKELGRATAYFLKGSPDGRTWTYLSAMPNHHVFSLGEPNLAVMDDGRIVCLLRTDWPTHLKDRWPEHVGGNGMTRDGYGWFVYQSESTDGGKTWTEPVQLPVWGHPPYMVKLASGSVVMVYGHRRPPYSIRAILSRDGGRTWDLSTLKMLREFKPGNYDLGYPVATQLPDGRIFCAYYGYSTPDIELYVPHGIFATIFSEDWLVGQ